MAFQSGVCGCERGYTEVMTTHGFLDYCTRTPGVDSSKKADVKTNTGRSRPRPSQGQDLFNEWTLRPIGPGTEAIITDERERVTCSCRVLFWKILKGVYKVGLSQVWRLNPLKLPFVYTDGRVKLWVYAVTAVGFIFILFVIALTFLLWYVSFLSRFEQHWTQF